MKSKFFESRRVIENVTMIAGLAGEQCYLIEGTEKALLVDGLSGVGSLKAFVRELTDLPVELVLTHAHPDHLGAAFEYGKCLLHPDEIPGLYDTGDAERRYDFVSGGERDFILRREDVLPCVPVCTLPVEDGSVFDLGDRELEVIAVPGHTWGHIVLLDRAARAVYTGDAVNSNTLLVLGGTSIEQYRESLLHLWSLEEAYDVPKQLQAVGVLVLRIAVGKMMPDIAQRRSAEQSVHHRVQQHVGVGMSQQPLAVRYLYAAEDQFPALSIAVYVISVSDSHTIAPLFVKGTQQFSPR